MSFSCTSFDITKATPWLCLWVSRVSCCPPVACRHQQPHTANHSQIRTLPLPTGGNNPCANTHIIVYPAGRSSTLTTCCCAVCYIKLPLPLPLAARPAPLPSQPTRMRFWLCWEQRLCMRVCQYVCVCVCNMKWGCLPVVVP